MRKFARSHWKIVLAILLAVALATLTMETDSATPGPELSARLRTHVQAIAPGAHDSARPSSKPHALEQAAHHIETTLLRYGYQLRRQQVEAGGRKLRNIEVSVSNTAAGVRPERIFIIGAPHDAARGGPDANEGGGTAAVLELARLLKTMRPSRGTEVKFVFFVNGERSSQADNAGRGPELERQVPGSGNFIAFVGTVEASARVDQALAAFTEHADLPAEGLAAPAHVMGVTLLDHSAYRRHGYAALMITDTAFLHYPYHHTVDTHDRLDYAGMARVVKGLARTIESLAGAELL